MDGCSRFLCHRCRICNRCNIAQSGRFSSSSNNATSTNKILSKFNRINSTANIPPSRHILILFYFSHGLEILKNPRPKNDFVPGVYWGGSCRMFDTRCYVFVPVTGFIVRRSVRPCRRRRMHRRREFRTVVRNIVVPSCARGQRVFAVYRNCNEEAFVVAKPSHRQSLRHRGRRSAARARQKACTRRCRRRAPYDVVHLQAHVSIVVVVIIIIVVVIIVVRRYRTTALWATRVPARRWSGRVAKQ
jgi:hypothetical protein